MQTNTTDLTVIENSLDLLKTGPDILRANKARTDKALEVGRNILTAITDGGMTPELDARAMKYLANSSAALKEMKEGRAGVTQIMEELKKMFTGIENQLDAGKAGTIPLQVQEHRNAYAKKLAEEKKRKAEEAERLAAKQKETVELTYAAGTRLAKHYNDYLLLQKSKLQDGFNGITLADFEEKEKSLRAYNPIYSEKHFSSFNASLYSTLHTPDELKDIVIKASAGKFTEFANNYSAEMNLLKQDLVDRLPSKRKELEAQKLQAEEAERLRQEEIKRQQQAEQKRQEEIAKANKEQKEELQRKAELARKQEAERMEQLKKEAEETQRRAEEEQKQREEQAAAKLKADAEEAQKKAELEAELQKQGDQTMIMFDKEAAMAEVAAAPEARQGYDLVVLHPAGYVQIFQFWFENEGKNLAVDKIGNTKMDQMKAYCEKVAHKEGTKIESKFLRYEDSYKAVNRKVATK